MRSLPSRMLAGFFCAGMIFTSVSCGDECGTIKWWLDVSDELALVRDTRMAYEEDPTTENCRAFETATEEYLVALENVEECVTNPADRLSFDEAVELAMRDLEDLQC